MKLTKAEFIRYLRNLSPALRMTRNHGMAADIDAARLFIEGAEVVEKFDERGYSEERPLKFREDRPHKFDESDDG